MTMLNVLNQRFSVVKGRSFMYVGHRVNLGSDNRILELEGRFALVGYRVVGAKVGRFR